MSKDKRTLWVIQIPQGEGFAYRVTAATNVISPKLGFIITRDDLENYIEDGVTVHINT